MSKNATVFLVDDDEDDRLLTREAFERTLGDVDIVEFSSGAELFEVLTNVEIHQPSFIVLDMNMPRMNGLEILDLVRSDPATRHIPIVLFSTGANELLIQKAYQAGANAYIVKPTSVGGYFQMANATILSFLDSRGTSGWIANQQYSSAKSIMIIEDNADHWNLMSRALKTSDNVNLIHLQSVEQTVSFLVSEYINLQPAVELIVLDLYLPGRQQGLELIETIREFFIIHHLPWIPIIIYSGSAHQEDIIASYQRMANAYIRKSVDFTDSIDYLLDVCRIWSSVIVTPQMSQHLKNPRDPW